jgi:hypothetical protein
MLQQKANIIKQEFSYLFKAYPEDFIYSFVFLGFKDRQTSQACKSTGQLTDRNRSSATVMSNLFAPIVCCC